MELMDKKIILSMIVCILLINLISALDFDNIKSDIILTKGQALTVGDKQIAYNDLWVTYKPIEVKNAFGLGETLFKGAITTHTNSCSYDCESIMTIQLANKGVLIEDIRFKRLVKEEWIDYDFNRYKIYYSNSEESYEQDVYETQCKNLFDEKNQTNYQDCNELKTGTQTLLRPIWQEYFNEELDAGTYQIKINGNKKVSDSLDWQIKTQGQWIEEWASWIATWNSSMYVQNYDDFNRVSLGANWTSTVGACDILSDQLRVAGAGEDCETTGTLVNNKTPNNINWLAKFSVLSSGSAYLFIYNATTTIFYFEQTAGNLNLVTPSGHATVTAITGVDTGLGYLLSLRNISWTAHTMDLYVNDSLIHSGINFLNTQNEFSKYRFVQSTGTGTTLVNHIYSEIAYSPVTLNSPLNNTTSNSATQTFNCSANTLTTLKNISLWTNSTGTWQLNETNIPYLKSTAWNYSGAWSSDPLTNASKLNDNDWSTGSYPIVVSNWGYSNHNYTNVTSGSIYKFRASMSGGSIRVSCYNYTSSGYSTLYYATTFLSLDNYTSIIPNDCINSGLTQIKLSLLSSGNVPVFYEGEINNTSSYTATFTKTLPQNSTIWNCQACDVDGSCSFAISNYTININSIAPVITITNGNGTNNLGILNQNHTINFTVTDTNLDKCWYFNGTNNLTSNCLIANKTIKFLSDNITLYANDTAGNNASQFVEWDFKVLKNNESYLNQTVEGAINNFLLNLSLKDGITINEVNLIYNGTSYTANAFLIDNYTIISKDIVIPGVITTTNYSFYWSIRLSDSTLINLSSNNQTVYNLSIDNCSAYSYEIYRFNLLDEETQVALSGVTTMDISMNIYSIDRLSNITYFNKSYSSTNPARICLGTTLSNQTNYSVDVIVRYEQNATHSIEYYNIVNDRLSNSSILQTINLYDLLLTDTTEFRLTFIDADFVPRENALIYLMRQYISENTFKTVELPKTDSNGQTILHLVRNDVIYNIIIIDSVSKQVLGTFNNIVAFCEDITIGKCEINLNAFSTEEEVYDYNSALGIIISNPNYNNNTRVISFDFVTTTGTSKTVNMLVTRNDIFGNNTVCDTTLISAGGTMSCSIPSTIENTNLITSIYVDGILVVYAHVQMDKSNLGYIGYIALFFMMISLVFMFSSSKEGVLVGLGLGVLAGIGLGLITGSVLGVGSAGIWIIVLIILAFWKLNQGRTS